MDRLLSCFGLGYWHMLLLRNVLSLVLHIRMRHLHWMLWWWLGLSLSLSLSLMVLSVLMMHLLLLLLFVVHLLSLVMIISHSCCILVVLIALRRILLVLLLLLLLLIMRNLVGVLLVHGLARTRVIPARHVGMRRQQALGNQSLDLLLALALIVQILLVRVLGRLVHRVPLLVLLELGALRLVDELLVADQVVLVRVRLLEHVLAHPLHLLGPFAHIVLGNARLVDLNEGKNVMNWDENGECKEKLAKGNYKFDQVCFGLIVKINFCQFVFSLIKFIILIIIHLIQFSGKQRLHLQLVPHTVAVQVVHQEEGLGVELLTVHVVLLLPHLLQLRLVPWRVQRVVLVVLLLLHLQLVLVLLLVRLVHRLHLLVLLELLLHLVPLELVPPQLVRLGQLVARLVDQLAQVLLLERVRILVVHVLRDLHVIAVDLVGQLELLDGQVTQPFQLPSF